VPRRQLGTATAAGLMFRQVGGSIAVALFGAIFATRMAEGLAGMPLNGLGSLAQLGPQTLSRMPPEALDRIAGAVSAGIHPIYWIAAALSFAGFVIALLLEDIALKGRGPDPAPMPAPDPA